MGQGVSVTPIQQVTATSAVVNGGTLYKPYILKSINDKTNTIIKENTETVVRKVISEETSNLMRRALESVVAKGGGKSAYIEGYRIGGKTGTAQKVENGRYMDNNYIMSFMSIVPSNKPEAVLYLAIDNPKHTALLSSYTTTPIARRILLDIIKILDIERQPEQLEKDLSWNDKEIIEVPNVIGKTKKEAKSILKDFKIEYSSTGNIIKEQSPNPYTKIEKGSIIKILLGDQFDNNYKITYTSNRIVVKYMYINYNSFNNNNEEDDFDQQKYQRTQRILGIILVTVLVLLVLLIVGKKLNIIDKADRIKPYATLVTIESNNVIDKYSAEVGNEVILTMEFSEKLRERPTVIMNNTPVGAVKEGNRYVAKFHVTEQYFTDKVVEFKIDNYRDMAKNYGDKIILTTDNSKVFIRAQNTIITPVVVSGISLETPKKVIKINESIQIKATVKPYNATNKAITWESSDPTIATVENGKVTALAEGKVTITATIVDKKASVDIIVKHKAIK